MAIVFSSTRKDVQAISSLTHYIFRFKHSDHNELMVVHNIHWKRQSKEEIMAAFLENDAFRKKRKNGVVVYHEILSFHPEDSDYLLDHPWVLETISRFYMLRRSPDGLGIAVLHQDKEHLHIHMMLSANKIESPQSTRLTKNEFRQIRRDVEQYQSLVFPQLKKSYVHPEIRKKIKTQMRLNQER